MNKTNSKKSKLYATSPSKWTGYSLLTKTKNKRIKVKNPLLVLRGVAMNYSDDNLFSNVDMTVNSGDRIAIIGPNGIGKSTLLKIIVGKEKPTNGNVIESKGFKIGYLPQEIYFKLLENTLLDEIYSVNCDKKDFYRHKGLSEKALADFGFSKKDWKRKIKTLSGGERTKLILAKILISEADLLVLDEATNHLDLETIEWLEKFLLNLKQAIICVSHDRRFLDKICNKTFELTGKGLEKYYCSYSAYLKEKEKGFIRNESEYKQQQKYLKHQQAFIDRFRFKATKARAVQSRIKQLKKLERVEKLTANTKEIKINFDVGRKVCNRILKADNFAVGRKESPLFESFDGIEINWGDKIGIVGKNGVGKSTLLKSILGMTKLSKGKIEIAKGIKMSYYAQSHEGIDPQKSILEEVYSKSGCEEEKIRNILGRLLFTENEVFKKIDLLSGGERARVALAELMLERSNFLLLDEPTNHLDLRSKEVVSSMLSEFEGTILLVSHDRYILDKACNFIWEIKEGKLKKYLGNYQDYRYQNKH